MRACQATIQTIQTIQTSADLLNPAARLESPLRPQGDGSYQAREIDGEGWMLAGDASGPRRRRAPSPASPSHDNNYDAVLALRGPEEG